MQDHTNKISSYATVTASLVVRDAKAAIDFYKHALGAEHLYSLTTPDGCVAHAEIMIGDSKIMMGSERVEWGNTSPDTLEGTPVIMNIMVDDPDATVAKATAAGAKLIYPVSDQFYGFRSGRIQDPEGHLWIISKMIEHVSPEEIQRRMNTWTEETEAAKSAENTIAD